MLHPQHLSVTWTNRFLQQRRDTGRNIASSTRQVVLAGDHGPLAKRRRVAGAADTTGIKKLLQL